MPPPPSAPTAPITMTVPRSPVKRPVKSLSRNSDNQASLGSDYDRASPDLTSKSVTKSIQKKMSRSYKLSATDGLETGSDSDIAQEGEKTYSINKFGLDHGKQYDSKMQDRASADPYEWRAQPHVRTTLDDKYVAPPFKPNISPIHPMKEDLYIREDSNKDNPLSNFETPYLSEFTRRLSLRTTANLPSVSRSSLTSSVIGHTPSPVLNEVKETDSNGHFSSLRSSYTTSNTRQPLLSSRYATTPAEKPRDIVRTFKSSTETKEAKNNQNMVSVVLVVVLALFFGLLAIMYLGLGSKTEEIPAISPDSNVPLCLLEDPDHSRPGVNCVLQENLEDVLDLLKKLQPILTKKAIEAACKYSDEVPYLTNKMIINMFTNKVTKFQIENDLNNAQVLAMNNPKWGISLMEVNDEGPGQVLDSMEKVVLSRVDGNIGMVILNPELPMQCYIKNKIYTVFSSLLIVAIGALAVICTHKSVLWYLRYKKRSEKEVFQLVSDIIGMIEAHHHNTVTSSPGGTQETYLAINHVRDELIPPKDRKKMGSIWEKAVTFLDENESRVRREVQQVAGEEFHVWRWLPSNNLNVSNSQVSQCANKKSKVWQGQAFETMEGSVNSLTCSPTPCLKIRHMFDPDVEFEEDWETKVQDAILEKCGDRVKILHIRVDRGSREGCVYMKCMSQEDAGKAYRSLHGWWFDSSLVTVKYLRLERYHERFPDAIHCKTPLKPSNNQ
ncbi:inner nuclear membrane protein Man1 isoform X2 [Cephus cinctus]|nr:inner nuclear membrane protein Man1 isoform X2 [Cephus cinctus]